MSAIKNPGRFPGLLYVLVSGAFALGSGFDKAQRDGVGDAVSQPARPRIRYSGDILGTLAVCARAVGIPIGIFPRVLGVLLVVSSFACVAESFIPLVLRQYVDAVSRWTAPLRLGEVVFMLWLLIMGAKPKAVARDVPTAAMAS